tara:strand:- start:9890 stop:11038 length:1149 start_codon:yes stop_codon:yes gene_type:complete
MKSGLVIYNILSGDADVSALVGTRIFPNVAKNKTQFPFIIYDVENEAPTDDKDGVSTLDVDGVMVSVYSKTYVEASDLARKIRTALDRVRGTFGGVVVQSIQYSGYNDLFDDDSGDGGIYRKALDFKIRIVNHEIIPYNNTYSLDFDGVDDYLTFGDSDVFTPNNSGANRGFSISFWVKLSTTGGGAIISKSNFFSVGLMRNEYEVRTQFASKPMITFYGNDSTSISQILTLNDALVAGTWYHLAFTFDLSSASTSIVGYLNGVQKTDGSGATYSSNGTWVAVSNTAADLQLSREGTVGNYRDCKIDEVALFDNELSPTIITSIYNLGTPNDLSGLSYLLGYWRMGDPNGTSSYPIISDDSANSNDGTMINMVSSDIVIDTP